MKNLYLASMLTGVLVISGCGDSDDTTPPSSTSSLSGTAAVGQAIANAAVTAQCQNGSDFVATVTTDANGAWSGEVSSGSFPCVITVSGGTPAVTLRSYANAAGTLNITPLTDLALIIQQATLDFSWADNTSLWPDATQLTATTNSLLAALSDNGYIIPAGSPFSTPFVIGDDWDIVLDDIKAAIDSSTSIDDYEALATLLKDGNYSNIPTSPNAPLVPEGDGAALAENAGATGTFNGETYTFTESTSWVENPLNNSGGFMANGPTPDSFWKVDRLLRKQDMVGKAQYCGSDPASSISIGLQLPASSLYYANPMVSACTLVLTEVSTQGFKAKFAATLHSTDTDYNTVIDGYIVYTGESDPVDPEPSTGQAILTKGALTTTFDQVSCYEQSGPDKVVVGLGQSEVFFEFAGSRTPESGAQYASTSAPHFVTDTAFRVYIKGYIYEYKASGLFYSGNTDDLVATFTFSNGSRNFKGVNVPTSVGPISFDLTCPPL